MNHSTLDPLSLVDEGTLAVCQTENTIMCVDMRVWVVVHDEW